VVATGLVVARDAIRRFRFGNVFNFWMKDISFEHQEHYTAVRDLIKRNLPDNDLIAEIEENEKIKVDVLYVINHWTLLATGIRSGLFDRQQTLWMNYAQVIYFFNGLRPWLIHRRQQTTENTIFHDFGWLYLESKKAEERLMRRWVRHDVQDLFIAGERDENTEQSVAADR
jgi:hypothetical protein